MKDTVSLVVATILLVAILLLFPLYNYFERQDDMTYNVALKTVTNFVDETINNGYVTQESYTSFVNSLSTTGYSFDIDLEIHRKVLTLDTTFDKYIEQYEIKYNKDIFDNLDNASGGATSSSLKLKNDAFFLNAGDQIYVRVKNKNTTMATLFLNLLVSTASSEKINISYGGTVKNTTWANTNVSDLYQGDIYVQMELLDANESDEKNAYPLYTLTVEDDRKIAFEIKLSNIDDESVMSKLSDNVKLVGEDPNIYIKPTSVTSTGTNEYKIEFILDEAKQADYLGENDYNRFHLFLPSGIIQGTFSKNKMTNSDYILLRKNEEVSVGEY